MMQSLLITLREGLELALIVVAGAAIFVSAGEFEGRAEEAFEGTVMLTAVGVLSWMIIWMKRQAVHIRADLQSRVDTAVLSGSALAVALVPFVAVLREGIETALFMFAASNTAQPWETAVGGSLGLLG